MAELSTRKKNRTNRHLEFLRHVDVTTDNPLPTNKTLRVGCDFAGIEAPIMALTLLQQQHRLSSSSRGVFDFQQMFSCEIDADCQKTIHCNYPDCKMYSDITQRNHSKLPKLDLYVAGFPCVSFSMLGKREGTADPTGRGLLFFDCVATIKATRPTVFVLENVKGLVTHNNRNTFRMVLATLKRLGSYHVQDLLMNTQDYGVLQNRERVFVVGIRKKNRLRPINTPSPIPSNITSIRHYLERPTGRVRNFEHLNHLTDHKIDLLKDLLQDGKIDSLQNDWFVNLNVSNSTRCNPMKGIVPCLLAGGGGNCVYYMTSIQRRLTPREYLRLQGFPDEFRQCVSDSKMYKQVGNSMSINVLCFLFVEIFRAVHF